MQTVWEKDPNSPFYPVLSFFPSFSLPGVLCCLIDFIWREVASFRIKTYVDGNGLFGDIGEMFKIRKNDNVIREKMNTLKILF